MERQNYKTFVEFLKDKKTHQSSAMPAVDWSRKKEEWLEALDKFYGIVHLLIINKFENAGYQVIVSKNKLTLAEEYIGSYQVDQLEISADDIKIYFNPVGCMIFNAKGRVDMVVGFETIKIILTETNEWKIVQGIGASRQLLDFDEENIYKLFLKIL